MMSKSRDIFHLLILPSTIALFATGLACCFFEVAHLSSLQKSLSEFAKDFALCIFAVLVSLFALFPAIVAKEWFEKVKDLQVFKSILCQLKFCIVFSFVCPIFFIAGECLLIPFFPKNLFIYCFLIFFTTFFISYLFANVFMLLKVFELMLKTGKEKK